MGGVAAAVGDGIMLAGQGGAPCLCAWVSIIGALAHIVAAVGYRRRLTLPCDAGLAGAWVTVIAVGVDDAAGAVGEMLALALAITDGVRARVSIINAVTRLNATVCDDAVVTEAARAALGLRAWIAVIEALIDVSAAPRDRFIEAVVVWETRGVDAWVGVGWAVDRELTAVRDERR